MYVDFSWQIIICYEKLNFNLFFFFKIHYIATMGSFFNNLNRDRYKYCAVAFNSRLFPLLFFSSSGDLLYKSTFYFHKYN